MVCIFDFDLEFEDEGFGVFLDVNLFVLGVNFGWLSEFEFVEVCCCLLMFYVEVIFVCMDGLG